MYTYMHEIEHFFTQNSVEITLMPTHMHVYVHNKHQCTYIFGGGGGGGGGGETVINHEITHR